jgi:sugar phosphate isomerase/epimerase
VTELLATCWTHAGTSYPYPDRDVSERTLRERAEAASVTGYTGFGIMLPDLQVALRDSSMSDIRHMLDDLGLTHIELEFLSDWWESGERRSASDQDRRALFAAAESLHADHVKIGATICKLPGETPPTLDVDRMAPSLHALAAEAADHGTRLAIEYVPTSDVATVRDALRLVQAADHPAAGICVDIWHTERGASRIDDIRAVPGDKVMAVELSDARAEVVGTLFEDTIHQRVMPGAGSFDIAGFVDAVRSTGFTGPWGVEIISAHERTRPILDTLRDARAAVLPYLEGDRAL